MSLVAGSFATAELASASPPTPSRVQDLAGCTDNTLPANDDGSTGLVPLGFEVSLNGAVHTSVYVNNNGNISFDRPYSQYTPFDFTASGSVMFAPFLADVDTRLGNQVTYGQTTVGGAPAFCVNWVDVGYYSQHVDKTNSFQLLMIDRGAGDFDLVYNYDRITWETGDASGGSNGFGGTSAAAGLSTGDGLPETNVMLAGSFVNGALLDGAANSLTAGGNNGAGSYLFPFRASDLGGGLVRGLVLGNDGGSDYPVPGAGVELCTTAGSCRVVTSGADGRYSFVSVAPGTYTVRARSQDHGPASRTVTVTGEQVYDLDIPLGASLVAVPDGWTAGSASGVVPVVWTDQPTTVTSPPMCDGSGTWTVRANNAVIAQGVLTKTPVAGSPGMVTYSAVVPALTANVGVARVTVEITCLPSGGGARAAAADEVVEFDLVTAPPSVVVDRTGAPVLGAEVTLQRSTTASGGFADVLPYTSVLGWADNPQYTDETGRVGWNTVAGFYRVVASTEDCTATSPVRQVPVQALTFSVTVDCSVPPTTTPTPTATPTPDPACAQKQAALATATAALTAAQQVLGQSTAKLQKATKKLAKAKKALKKAKKNGASGATIAKLAKKVKKAKKTVKKAKAAKKASAASVATAAAAVEAAKAALC
ncbi:hypothetical protein ASC64_12295 [Nocardioides sp. Root122]|nr:hypothetical protein ASC64_12295 [Nocardioides sp. Root122]